MERNTEEKPLESDVRKAMELIKSITGKEPSYQIAERVQKAFDNFCSFLESGEPMKRISDPLTAIGTVGSFQDFVHRRGGVLTTVEMWCLFAFLSWREFGYVLKEKEADLFQQFKTEVKKTLKSGRVVLEEEAKKKLGKLLQHWNNEDE